MAARVAFPAGGNPATVSGLVQFEAPDSDADDTIIPDTLVGFSLCESAGAAAKVRLHDGTSSGAPPLCAAQSLAANQTINFALPTGVQVESGAVWVEVISGSVEVAVYW